MVAGVESQKIMLLKVIHDMSIQGVKLIPQKVKAHHLMDGQELVNVMFLQENGNLDIDEIPKCHQIQEMLNGR